MCVQVLIRATKYSRTFQSAVAFMHGFAPDVDVSRMSALQMADNNTLCTPQTGHQCACAAVESGFLDAFSVPFGQRSSSIRDLPAVHRIAARLRLTVDKLPRLSHVFDVAMAHFCHGFAVDCLGAEFVRDVFHVTDEIGRLTVSDVDYQRLARLKLQPLVYEIAHRMKQQALAFNGNSLPKFILYSGHDSSIEPLAAVFEVSSGAWPRYASRLVFELYAPTKETYSDMEAGLRVLHDGEDVTSRVSFCKGLVASSVCPLKAFLDFVNDSKFAGGPGETGYTEACRHLVS